MSGLDKVRDEMAKAKTANLQFLGEGLTALMRLYPGTEAAIGAQGKSLSGCLDAIRKAAKGGVADPEAATRAICEYYGLDGFGDYRRLAAEVNLALMGGETQEQGTAKNAPPLMPAGQAAADDGEQGTGIAQAAQAPAEDFDIDALLEGL